MHGEETVDGQAVDAEYRRQGDFPRYPSLSGRRKHRLEGWVEDVLALCFGFAGGVFSLLWKAKLRGTSTEWNDRQSRI